MNLAGPDAHRTRFRRPLGVVVMAYKAILGLSDVVVGALLAARAHPARASQARGGRRHVGGPGVGRLPAGLDRRPEAAGQPQAAAINPRRAPPADQPPGRVGSPPALGPIDLLDAAMPDLGKWISDDAT